MLQTFKDQKVAIYGLYPKIFDSLQVCLIFINLVKHRDTS